jgi:hypothetical protein
VRQATRYGKLPHEVIFADNAGWDDEVKFAWNDAVTQYVEEFERMQKATHFVTARRPPTSRTTYKKEVADYNRDQLLEYLGVDPKMIEKAKENKHVLTDDMWATMEQDNEWEVEPD